MGMSAAGTAFSLGSQGFFKNDTDPVAATLSNGKIAVAWSANLMFVTGYEDTDFSILARIFNPDGTPVGDVFAVNATTDGLQGQPEIAALKDGFAVTWTSNAPIGSGHNDTDIMAQLFTNSGARKGGEITVTRDAPTTGADNADDDNEHTNIAALPGGGFVSVWTDRGPDEGNFAQIFDASGKRVGPEVQVSDQFTFVADVDVLSNGNIVIVNDNGNTVDVWLSGASLNGAPKGVSGATGPLTINLDNGRNNTATTLPQVAALAGGGFVVAYRENPTTGASNFRFETFDAKAKLVNALEMPVVMSSGVGSGDYELVARKDGGFVFTWVDVDASSTGVFARAFNADGSFNGDAVRVNPVETNQQILQSVTETADGKLFFAWTDLQAAGTVDTLQGRVFEATPSTGGPPEPIRGTNGKDTLEGTGGDDTIIARGGSDTVRGKSGDDSISGGGGNDRLFGDSGKDTIEGGTGRDQIDGGKSNDVLRGNGGNDKVKGGGGNDKLTGSSGNDTLSGGSGKDLLDGGKGNDLLRGDGGNDTLKGSVGADVLIGGSGKDRLVGGGGNDTLTGGSKADAFLFGNGSGNDIITDYQSIDTVEIQTGRRIKAMETGDGTLLDWGKGSVLLEGVALEDWLG